MKRIIAISLIALSTAASAGESAKPYAEAIQRASGSCKRAVVLGMDDAQTECQRMITLVNLYRDGRKNGTIDEPSAAAKRLFARASDNMTAVELHLTGQ